MFFQKSRGLTGAVSPCENLIPAKSKRLYDFAFQRFVQWYHKHNTTKYSENVFGFVGVLYKREANSGLSCYLKCTAEKYLALS